MDQDLVGPEKSTIVRSEKTKRSSLNALRLGLRVLSSTAPSLAVRVAERLFFTARRRPRPAREHEVLERARTFSVGFRGGFLPVWSWGQGPTVILVHGWEGRGAQLRDFIDPLVEAGFRVVTFDAPGHGDGPNRRTSLPDFATALDAVLDAVGPAHAIVAHSMGALSTALALSRLSRASRAVFVAPPIDPDDFFGAFSRFLAIDPDIADRARRSIESRLSIAMDELHGERLATRVHIPLLIFHDQNDREVPWTNGKALADAWDSATMITTQGLGHQRILSDPEVIRRTVAFVRGHAQTDLSSAMMTAAR